MADKEEKNMKNQSSYMKQEEGLPPNPEMAGFNISEDIENDNNLDKDPNTDRHNENARATAALESELPRINTENL
ncbi:hypothetical protein HNQ94_000965 [Salirhabdus euzebyi]|uniref:Uncharacterized protein n=1 Tax=Salirhabdus euzebyi TaxID=394506 RepID=A0A841PUN5_9BACI|nr:hypothetical protein [Salirhabdus euzebyi]MBB6452520.1 hypothetical protein [Salirhabdus euzebyi]